MYDLSRRSLSPTAAPTAVIMAVPIAAAYDNGAIVLSGSESPGGGASGELPVLLAVVSDILLCV